MKKSQAHASHPHENRLARRKLVRAQLGKALLSLGLLLAVSFVLGVYFETHIQMMVRMLIEKAHPWVIVLFVFLNDCIISPFPPDIILVLLSRLEHDPSVESFVLILGLASGLAGSASWLLARTFLKPHWFGAGFQRFLEDFGPKVQQYGKWVVALGALTPLPYSMTCWAAGFLKMKFRPFFWMTLLRIPRFWIYFHILRTFGEMGRGLAPEASGL